MRLFPLDGSQPVKGKPAPLFPARGGGRAIGRAASGGASFGVGKYRFLAGSKVIPLIAPSGPSCDCDMMVVTGRPVECSINDHNLELQDAGSDFCHPSELADGRSVQPLPERCEVITLSAVSPFIDFTA